MNLKQFIKPFIFYLLGAAVIIIGATFKILHLQFAPQLLIVGMLLEVIAIFYTVIILIKIIRK